MIIINFKQKRRRKKILPPIANFCWQKRDFLSQILSVHDSCADLTQFILLLFF